MGSITEELFGGAAERAWSAWDADAERRQDYSELPQYPPAWPGEWRPFNNENEDEGEYTEQDDGYDNGYDLLRGQPAPQPKEKSWYMDEMGFARDGEDPACFIVSGGCVAQQPRYRPVTADNPGPMKAHLNLGEILLFAGIMLFLGAVAAGLLASAASELPENAPGSLQDAQADANTLGWRQALEYWFAGPPDWWWPSANTTGLVVTGDGEKPQISPGIMGGVRVPAEFRETVYAPISGQVTSTMPLIIRGTEETATIYACSPTVGLGVWLTAGYPVALAGSDGVHVSVVNNKTGEETGTRLWP